MERQEIINYLVAALIVLIVGLSMLQQGQIKRLSGKVDFQRQFIMEIAEEVERGVIK